MRSLTCRRLIVPSTQYLETKAVFLTLSARFGMTRTLVGIMPTAEQDS